jgi:hypothetical protein
MKRLMKYRLLIYILLSVFISSCVPTVYSPHAQNEMIAPFNGTGEIHEIGIAPALNLWAVSQHTDTAYIKTYPTTSISLFHNVNYAQGAVGGIGGIELISFPTRWYVSGGDGFVFVLKPYAGLQYSSVNLTMRANFSPFSLAFGIAGGEWEAGGTLNKLTFYQLCVLLHNRRCSKHVVWVGARNSPAAIGALAGYEYCFNEKHIVRLEGSVLGKPPFSLLLNDQELERIRGYVFYSTAGVFFRLK